MKISNEAIRATYLGPGELRYYSLDDLKKAAEDADFTDWGICEYNSHYWAGIRVSVEGKDALRLTLFEVLEKRDEEYGDWGDEEVYLMVGVDEDSHAFKWYLLNEEEFQRNEEHYGGCS